MKIQPETTSSPSYTRFTILDGLPHLGQSVLLVVSITFLRSAVLAIFAIGSPRSYWCKRYFNIGRVVAAYSNVHDWQFINKTDISYRNFQFDGPKCLAYVSSFMTTRHHHHHHDAHSATAGV